MSDDYRYYSRRVVQEDKAARVAVCLSARLRHEELADAYRTRCALIAGRLEAAVIPLIAPVAASHGVGRHEPMMATALPA